MGGLLKGAGDRMCSLGNAGERALEIRAFFTLTVLLRGRTKQKYRTRTVRQHIGRLSLNHRLADQPASQGESHRPFSPPLLRAAENADWGLSKFLLSNLSEALGSAMRSFYLSLGSSFFSRLLVFVSEISTVLSSFPPCPHSRPTHVPLVKEGGFLEKV